MSSVPSAPTSSTDAAGERRSRRRDLVAVNIGNTLEWFDWNVYAIFAPFFATQFFRPGDAFSALLSTLAVFAVGFLMRPLGGVVFGWLADRYGRRVSLTLAILLAAAGSLAIAVAPTYGSVGAFASLWLLLARAVQGLSHGGETGSALTYLAEIAPAGRRGLWSSTPWVGVALGTMLATGVGAVLTGALSRAQMSEWGWRVPFVLGALVGIYALVLRRKMAESDLFRAKDADASARDAEPSKARMVWRERRSVLLIGGMTVSGAVAFYTWLVFAPANAVARQGMDPTEALVASLLAQCVFIAVLPVSGRLSDRLGRRPVLQVFSIGFALAALPLDLLVQGAFWQLLLAMSIAVTLISTNCAPLGAVFAELVPTRVRATGIGLAYSTAVALFGGTAPYLNTWLSGNGRHLFFVGYLIVLCLVTAVCVARMPETRGRALR